MNGYLRQSTAAQARLIGPFLDDTDFKTAETGLTIANTDIKLRANGTTLANKNSGGGTHQVNGEYSVTWDATDTANVGELAGSVVVAGALPVFFTYIVLEEVVYDALYAAAAPGFQGANQVDLITLGDLGDFDAGATFDAKFVSRLDRVLTTLGGSPVVSIYKDNSLTQITAGITLTVDFDGVTGLNNVHVVLSADGTAYSLGSNYQAVITVGTVGGLSVVGRLAFAFSMGARSFLRPEVAGSTVAVNGLGEVTAANPGPTASQIAAAVALEELIVGEVLDKTGYSSSSADIIAQWSAADRQLSTAGVAAIVAALVSSFETVLARVPAILATALGSEYLGTVTGAATATTLIDSGLVETAVDHWKDRVIIFLTGTLAKQAKRITAFDPSTDALTFEAFTGAPSADDTYLIV